MVNQGLLRAGITCYNWHRGAEMRRGIFMFFLFFVSFFPVMGTDFEYGAFDPAFWNGLVFVKDGHAFAFRFVIHKGKETADGYDTFYLVERVGPFAPDGSFAEVSFNPFLPFGKKRDTPILEKNTEKERLLNLRGARYQAGVVGSLTIPAGIEIETLFYNPWDARLDYKYDHGHVEALADSQRFLFIPVGTGFERSEKRGQGLGAWVGMEVRTLYFYAGFAGPKLSSQEVEKILADREKRYQAGRPEMEGEWPGLIASICCNLAWMKLYQPDKKAFYIPAGRRWIFPKPDGSPDLWTVFEWDAFFNALEVVLEDARLARAEIEAVLDTQYANGNIPNWRSAQGGAPDRSQPPVGSFAVLKTYYRLQDISILESSYNRLKKWHSFWKAPGINGTPRRDGNADGLLEWGSDPELISPTSPEWEKKAPGRQRAAWESGEDDLPNYDEVPFDEKTNTLKMNCIDLSSLYALDAEMLMRIALILDKKEDAEGFKREYEETKHKINQQLWNESFYFDRFWEGKFSNHKAASNFHPLIAGVASKDQAQKMVDHLLDEKEFWGNYVIPTISRDNPAFKDQQYWRGTIWPPTNYLLYQGLKRYGFDEVAAQFARKSAALFLKSWQTYGLCRENYDSVTGEGGGQRYQSWGPLFALILLEDFIDISPFDGFRLGNLAASKKNVLKNIRLNGDTHTLLADKNSLSLWRGSKEILHFKGRAVLRHIQFADGSLEFEAHVTGKKITFLPVLFGGRPFSLELAGKISGSAKTSINILQGFHKVVLRKQTID